MQTTKKSGFTDQQWTIPHDVHLWSTLWVSELKLIGLNDVLRQQKHARDKTAGLEKSKVTGVHIFIFIVSKYIALI